MPCGVSASVGNEGTAVDRGSDLISGKPVLSVPFTSPFSSGGLGGARGGRPPGKDEDMKVDDGKGLTCKGLN